jgi:cell division protein FtsW (lipid II flippase)
MSTDAYVPTSDILDSIIAPRPLGSIAIGLALLWCVAYGAVRKDRRFLHIYCFLSPVYVLLLLFYVLPQDYSQIVSINVPFLAEIYGDDGSGPVIVILAVCLIVIYSVLSWLYAWKKAVKISAKRYHNNTMLDAESDYDDHPYQRKRCASYL